MPPGEIEIDAVCSGPDETGLFSCSFDAYSTSVVISGYYADSALPDDPFAPFHQAVLLCRRYEFLLSRLKEGSDIWRVNHGEGALTEVSCETFEAVASALDYCARSQGYFDITMGAATQLWNFHIGIMPDPKTLAEAMTHVGWQNVALLKHEDGRCFVRLGDPRAVLDLGGTAKGLIADKLVELLRTAGFRGALINIGGNVAVFGGKPGGHPWRIGLNNPRDSGKPWGAVPLREGAVVTSGIYERCFTKDGKTYHHILDTSSGMPVETDLLAASVVADNATDAEGYSTTLLSMGSVRALEYSRGIPCVQVILMLESGEILTG